MANPSKAGFTIASALVGIAIAAIGMIAIVQGIRTGQQGQRSVQNSLDFDLIKGSIEKIASSSAACSGAFQAGGGVPMTFDTSAWPAAPVIAAPGIPIPVVQLASGGGPIVTLNQQLPGRLTITQLHWTAAASDIQFISGGITWRKYLATLTMTATKAGVAMGGNLLTTNILVPIFVNIANDRIEQCGTWNAGPQFVVSPVFSVAVPDTDPGGTTNQNNMGPHRFCFLTTVMFDDGDDALSCTIAVVGANWLLRAFKFNNSTAVSCSARCID